MDKLMLILGFLNFAALTTMGGKPIKTPCKPCYGKFWIDSKDMGPLCTELVNKVIKNSGGDTNNYAAPKNIGTWDILHEAFDETAQGFGALAENMDQELICKKMIEDAAESGIFDINGHSGDA